LNSSLLLTGLNKYGTAEEVRKFESWLKSVALFFLAFFFFFLFDHFVFRCYGKAESKKDKKGRTIWYSTAHLEGPNEPILEATATTTTTVPAVASFPSFSAEPSDLNESNVLRPAKSMEQKSEALLLLSVLARTRRITAAEKGKLKDLVLKGQSLVNNAVEAFTVDRDWGELVDTLKRLCLRFGDVDSLPPQPQSQPQQDRFFTAPVSLPVVPATTTTATTAAAGSSLQDLLTDPSWRRILSEEFHKPYFIQLEQFLKWEENRGVQIYPPKHMIFHALNLCPFEKVKVVILGQGQLANKHFPSRANLPLSLSLSSLTDPYPGPGQAMGLSFSVPFGVPPPAVCSTFYPPLFPHFI
jgi:hypothetical protein